MTEAMTVWRKINSDVLNQGDLLRGLVIPSLPETFPGVDEDGILIVGTISGNVIILSQSCDLEHCKLPYVLVAQTFTVDEFETKNPHYKTGGRWKEASRGRVEALHVIACPEPTDDAKNHVVVDFRLLASLPFGYVKRFAEQAGDRWRLQSPYLEAWSQASRLFDLETEFQPANSVEADAASRLGEVAAKTGGSRRPGRLAIEAGGAVRTSQSRRAWPHRFESGPPMRLAARWLSQAALPARRNGGAVGVGNGVSLGGL